MSKIIDPTKEEKLPPPFPPENLVIVCASPAYGYIGVAVDMKKGYPTLLKHAVALVPVQVSSRLATPGAAPSQDTAMMPPIGGKSGAVEALHFPVPMTFYRVADMHPADRDVIYGAYMDMTEDAWPKPTDA